MNITRTSTPDGVGLLTFDRDGSSANIFDRATLDELDAHLALLETITDLKGVIVTALGLILTGKQIVGAQALKTSLVDDVTHLEYLLAAAQKLLARGKRPARPLSWNSRAPLSGLVASKARRDVRAKTRGHYPAPLKAIEVCTAAVSRPLAAGFARERAALLELVRTPECRNLMGVFFLQERAK